MASSSFVVPPRRPIGLMVLVLIVDLGLAATGGVLLSKGLATKDDKKSDAKTEPAPVEKKSSLETPSVPAAAAAAAPKADDRAAFAAVLTPEPTPTAAARESPKRDKAPVRPGSDLLKTPDAKPATKPADAKPVTKPDEPKPAEAKPVTKPDEPKPDSKPVTGVPAEPQDPYKAPNTEQEIDAAAARSSAAFNRCAADASAHGAIKVAFQVRYDGRVINAAAVENTTGNAELARCLVAEISSWHVSAHNGTTINLVRPFTYP